MAGPGAAVSSIQLSTMSQIPALSGLTGREVSPQSNVLLQLFKRPPHKKLGIVTL